MNGWIDPFRHAGSASPGDGVSDSEGTKPGVEDQVEGGVVWCGVVWCGVV